MGRRLLVTLLPAILLLLAIPGTAGAHILTAETFFSRRKAPPGVVESGETVAIFGKLKSSAGECFVSQTVFLMRRQKGPDKTLARDVTDVEGEYIFQRRPRRNQKWYVRYHGYLLQDPSHTHNCLGTRSRVVKIRVER
jgi:hypothetical protein